MESSNEKAGQDFKITGNWAEQSRELKNKFSQLTDADLKFEKGKDQEVIGRIENRLKKNRFEVVNILKKIQTKV